MHSVLCSRLLFVFCIWFCSLYRIKPHVHCTCYSIMSHRFTPSGHTPICIDAQTLSHTHAHMLKTEFLNNIGLNQATSNSSEFIRSKGWESEAILLLFTDATSTSPRFITRQQRPQWQHNGDINFFDFGFLPNRRNYRREKKSFQQAQQYIDTQIQHALWFELQ